MGTDASSGGIARPLTELEIGGYDKDNKEAWKAVARFWETTSSSTAQMELEEILNIVRYYVQLQSFLGIKQTTLLDFK